MSARRIASTPRNTMHALIFQGITVSESYPQISRMLRQRLGEDYALLFAEPQAGPERIDWYSPAPGSPRRLGELPEDERAALLNRLASMGLAIQSLADGLQKSGDELKATRGHVLELALRYPSEDNIFAVGSSPVLTCWGFGPGTPGVEPQILSRPGALPGQAAPPRLPLRPAAAAGNGSGRAAWLIWLLPLALLCLLLWLLFTGFGGMPALSGLSLWQVGLPPFMESPEELAGRLRQEEYQAHNGLDSLKASIEAHAASCKRNAGQVPGESPESLRIPEKADNPAFMAGRWLCSSGLVNQKSHARVQFEFSFDDKGKGSGVVHEKNDACEGAASARVANGVLRVRLEPQVCRKSGAVYSPLEIECRETGGGRNQCRGRNRDGSYWDATFSRIR